MNKWGKEKVSSPKKVAVRRAFGAVGQPVPCQPNKAVAPDCRSVVLSERVTGLKLVSPVETDKIQKSLAPEKIYKHRRSGPAVIPRAAGKQRR